MGYTKDLWTRPVKVDGKVVTDGKGNVVREPNARHGKGKRWQANWQDPNGDSQSKTFINKVQANEYWRNMETDRDRGDYINPGAGKEKFRDVAKRWLDSRASDPKSIETYDRAYRLHIKPKFGNRAVKGIKPSEIQALLVATSIGNRQTVRLVLSGVFKLAVGDGLIRKSPVTRESLAATERPLTRPTIWSDAQVLKLINAHPAELKLAPIILSGCGLRESEMYGLSVADLIEGDDPMVWVRRQVKRVGGTWVFALPKRDKQRKVPMPGFVRAAIDAHPVKPLSVTLPWETPDGKPQTHQLLVSKDGEHLRADRYKTLWTKGLGAAGLPRSSENGRHALRHYYATVQVNGGVSIVELAGYLGHEDPGYTMRIYQHPEPDAHTRSRKAIDGRLFRPVAV